MPKFVQFDKSEILESLIPLFIDKGYNGTSMQDIVDCTQLNRSSLYNTFGDKYQLYQAVLKRYSERQNGISEQILSINPDVKLALRKFLKNLFVTNQKEGQPNGCLLTKCALELSEDQGGIQELLQTRKKVMINALAQVISKGQEQNNIRPDLKPEEMALFFYNTIQGLRVLNANCHNEAETASVIDSLMKQF